MLTNVYLCLFIVSGRTFLFRVVMEEAGQGVGGEGSEGVVGAAGSEGEVGGEGGGEAANEVEGAGGGESVARYLQGNPSTIPMPSYK